MPLVRQSISYCFYITVTGVFLIQKKRNYVVLVIEETQYNHWRNIKINSLKFLRLSKKFPEME
jgi:hypothetical protein